VAARGSSPAIRSTRQTAQERKPSFDEVTHPSWAADRASERQEITSSTPGSTPLAERSAFIPANDALAMHAQIKTWVGQAAPHQTKEITQIAHISTDCLNVRKRSCELSIDDGAEAQLRSPPNPQTSSLAAAVSQDARLWRRLPRVDGIVPASSGPGIPGECSEWEVRVEPIGRNWARWGCGGVRPVPNAALLTALPAVLLTLVVRRQMATARQGEPPNGMHVDCLESAGWL